MSEGDAPEDWEFVTDHTFVGMDVLATRSDGTEIEGTIAEIWEYQGQPRRLDVDRGDEEPPLNIDRDRVEVVQ